MNLPASSPHGDTYVGMIVWKHSVFAGYGLSISGLRDVSPRLLLSPIQPYERVIRPRVLRAWATKGPPFIVPGEPHYALPADEPFDWIAVAGADLILVCTMASAARWEALRPPRLFPAISRRSGIDP